MRRYTRHKQNASIKVAGFSHTWTSPSVSDSFLFYKFVYEVRCFVDSRCDLVSFRWNIYLALIWSVFTVTELIGTRGAGQPLMNRLK